MNLKSDMGFEVFIDLYSSEIARYDTRNKVLAIAHVNGYYFINNRSSSFMAYKMKSSDNEYKYFSGKTICLTELPDIFYQVNLYKKSLPQYSITDDVKLDLYYRNIDEKFIINIDQDIINEYFTDDPNVLNTDSNADHYMYKVKVPDCILENKEITFESASLVYMKEKYIIFTYIEVNGYIYTNYLKRVNRALNRLTVLTNQSLKRNDESNRSNLLHRIRKLSTDELESFVKSLNR